jgi:hypothetical protein
MRAALDPFSLVVISIAGWTNQHQQHVIDYLPRRESPSSSWSSTYEIQRPSAVVRKNETFRQAPVKAEMLPTPTFRGTPTTTTTLVLL